MSNLVLSGEGLHLWRGDRHVLRGVSLELRGGQVLQLTGSNGAGKTTLLRVLCGLAYAEEGNVFWRGENVRKNMHAYHAELAYVGHEPPLKADLTARENLRYWVGERPTSTGPLTKLRRTNGGIARCARFPPDSAGAWRSQGSLYSVCRCGYSMSQRRIWIRQDRPWSLDCSKLTLRAAVSLSWRFIMSSA